MTENTDPFFGFVVGLYAATLVVLTVTGGVALRVTTDPGALFFAVLGTVTATVAGVGYLTRSERLAVRLGRTRWTWMVAVAPVGYGAVLLATVAADGPTVATAVAIVGMIVGLFVGIGLVAAAQNRHARAGLAAAEELARFDASAPARERRTVTVVATAMFVVAVGGLAASALVDLDRVRWLFHALPGVAAGLFGWTAERTVRVTDTGLVVGNPVHKHLRSWSAFESFSLTEEALVLHRTGRSLWGLRDFRRDPDEIEDADAVAAALGEFLPRREE